jgi:hypothetical protein
VRVSTLRTGEITTAGGILPGTPDIISGEAFVLSGALVDQVINKGPVTTTGQNDMVLDDWGEVTTWTAKAPVISNGPSGIGFVNFGAIDRLDVQAPIQTFGTGAREFNLYESTLRHASFHSIAIHGDDSVGVQVSKALPTLGIAGNLATDGGEGKSLVKGVQVSLKAIALSVKAGGYIGSVDIGGDDVITVETKGSLTGSSSAAGSGPKASVLMPFTSAVKVWT